MAGRDARVQLVICRHTQTDDNAQRRYTGQNDVSLNATGVEQAEQLAQKIAASFHVQSVLSSDLIRTQVLARKISETCSSVPPVEFTPGLREADVGRMANLTKADALIQFPDSQYRSRNPFYDYRGIGGEYADDVASRCIRAIDEEVFRVTRLYEHELVTLVIVGHGTALRTVFVDRLRLFRKLHEQGDFQVCDWFISQL